MRQARNTLTRTPHSHRPRILASEVGNSTRGCVDASGTNVRMSSHRSQARYRRLSRSESLHDSSSEVLFMFIRYIAASCEILGRSNTTGWERRTTEPEILVTQAPRRRGRERDTCAAGQFLLGSHSGSTQRRILLVGNFNRFVFAIV